MNVPNVWRRAFAYMIAGVLVVVLSGCTSFLLVEREPKEEVWDLHEPRSPIYEEVYGKIVIPEDVYQP
ncbi:hypothetical protein NQ117_18600 [Paenibacillus sp. SC116]|uniref:hypothetical protein n=1 Tax=Paenibacillus sp. SC116 TaxID=2968986 RepID=UPI00215A6732|nr:hypothetical protein [Paenibacillus sp. SC116]MCR8845699.1 hypothetical protein [Paenibacillus sp. SC116]